MTSLASAAGFKPSSRIRSPTARAWLNVSEPVVSHRRSSTVAHPFEAGHSEGTAGKDPARLPPVTSQPQPAQTSAQLPYRPHSLLHNHRIGDQSFDPVLQCRRQQFLHILFAEPENRPATGALNAARGRALVVRILGLNREPALG